MQAGSDQLRVEFEASSLHQAVELASELRAMADGRIQIRPAPRRLLSRRWNVTMTIPAMPRAFVLDLTTELHELAGRHPGCQFVDADSRGATQRSDGRIRVLIVDDSPPFRRAARELLRRRGYLVVGEAGSAVAACEAVERTEPDALLVDVGLPDGCGFELAGALIRARPELAVLLVSATEPPARDQRLSACGARGFVPKSCLAAVELERFWQVPSPSAGDVAQGQRP